MSEPAVTRENFRLEKVPLPQLPQGGLLLRVLYLSLDPWISAAEGTARLRQPADHRDRRLPTGSGAKAGRPGGQSVGPRKRLGSPGRRAGHCQDKHRPGRVRHDRWQQAVRKPHRQIQQPCRRQYGAGGCSAAWAQQRQHLPYVGLRATCSGGRTGASVAPTGTVQA
jgi:hypothetical protein